jgi:hypothetical protein
MVGNKLVLQEKLGEVFAVCPWSVGAFGIPLASWVSCPLAAGCSHHCLVLLSVPWHCVWCGGEQAGAAGAQVAIGAWSVTKSIWHRVDFMGEPPLGGSVLPALPGVAGCSLAPL